MVLRSQNGLSANDRSKIGTYLVPGTSTRLAVRKGNVATVLLYVASEFDKHVEDIDTPTSKGYARDDLSIDGSSPSRVFDDWSFAVRLIRGSSTSMSNHSSGSAIDLNATQHPLGVGGTYTAAQLREIRKILAYCEGVVRFGGFYEHRIDPMHFEVIGSSIATARVARKIRKKWAAEKKAAAKAKATRLAKARAALAAKAKAARAKAAAALATKRAKAAALAAAAAAAAALAAGGAAVITDDPTPTPGVTSTATPTASPSPSATKTVKPAPVPTVTTPTKAKPVLRRTLRYTKGSLMHGADVKAVQRLVGAKIDGDLGPATKAKIVAYQHKHHLNPSGIFGRAEAKAAGWGYIP